MAASATEWESLLRSVLGPAGVEHFGVCRFSDCLPLLPCRGADRLPALCRSVIVLLFPNWTGPFPGRNVARYAILPDYHRVAGGILRALTETLIREYPGEGFACFVDSSPLPEVRGAHLAGLGAKGRNGLLISPDYGSHVFIGAVATTMDLPPSRPGPESCAGCGRCIAACPTGALGQDGHFQAGLCRSHITQKKGVLTPWEEEQVRQGGLAWGCDICTDVCPMNPQAPTPVQALYEHPAPVLTLENLSALRKEKPYGYRGRAVLERNLRILSGA